jgi:hypothetical protein
VSNEASQGNLARAAEDVETIDGRCEVSAVVCRSKKEWKR